MNKYITLTRMDFSLAILRVDRIKDMRVMPGDRTEITYANLDPFLVRETLIEVRQLAGLEDDDE